MKNPIQQAVSESIRQTNLPMDRLWTGLCVACCHALNWPLSLENLGAVKHSLLSMYAPQWQWMLNPGVKSESAVAAWSMFAPKVVAVLKRDSRRMLMRTPFHFLDFRQSSLTRLIYLTRRKLRRSVRRSLSGSPTKGSP